MIYSIDTPFWSETLEIVILYADYVSVVFREMFEGKR